jgi:hypothetical protein
MFSSGTGSQEPCPQIRDESAYSMPRWGLPGGTCSGVLYVRRGAIGKLGRSRVEVEVLGIPTSSLLLRRSPPR